MTESSSCFWVSNTQATLIQRITSTIRRSSEWIVSILVCGSFKHSVGTERIDKRTILKCNTIVSHIYVYKYVHLYECSYLAMIFTWLWRTIITTLSFLWCFEHHVICVINKVFVSSIRRLLYANDFDLVANSQETMQNFKDSFIKQALPWDLL